MNKVAVRVCALALAVVVSGISLLSLGGCQTVKGVGQDIKNAGEAGERAID